MTSEKQIGKSDMIIISEFFKQFEVDLKQAGLNGRFIDGTCESPQYGLIFTDLIVSYAGRVMFFRVLSTKVPIRMTDDFADFFFDGQLTEIYSVPELKEFIQEKIKEKDYFNALLLIKELNATNVKKKAVTNQMPFSKLVKEIEEEVFTIGKLKAVREMCETRLTAIKLDASITASTIKIKFQLKVDDTRFSLIDFSVGRIH